MKCPEQHRRRYVEGDIIPPASALIRGTAVHVGAETNFKQKIDTRQDLPAKDIIEAAVSTVQSRVRTEGLWLSPEQETEGKGKVVNAIEKDVITLTRLYATDVAPAYQPVLVEQEMTFKVDGLEGVEVGGRIDTISEAQEVVDLKTYGKKANEDTMNADPQPTMYALLKLLKTGTPARSVNMEILVLKKEPEHQRITIVKRKADFVALLEQVKAIAGAIKSGIAPGAYGQMGAWWCSKNQCGYWKTCRFVPEHKR
jgi:hypothetical protein